MDAFAPATRLWVEATFSAPTQAQTAAWEAIGRQENVLVVAPTGSGKTLAAFLWSLDRLMFAPGARKVLYVSPLKALAFDVERNLRVPLTGIRQAAERLDLAVQDVSVGVRTGDTPADERRRLARHAVDILITTPESLFLLLTSKARETLLGIDTVIVDEVHAMAGTKRGAHLALSLERLDMLLPGPARRIGLSATVRPQDEMARFLGGHHPVTLVQPPSHKAWDLKVEIPTDQGDETLWPAIELRLVELVRSHQTTIVFANSRRLAERLCARLNEVAGEDLARAHHGSVSREQRRIIEDDLKGGRLKAVVATSSLELGIDMGAVDLVVQVEAPPSVAAGLQRIGRAGHGVGQVSRGIILPKWRGDLIRSAVVSERMQAGAIESIRYLRNPLDVLAQHIVSMVALDDWTTEGVATVVRRAAPFATLPASALDGVLDMLSGKYPADEFAELRPHLNWDRERGILSGRRHAQRLAVTNGGTIPDRGLFGVFLAGEKPIRVGELDEEMVYESRKGETFTLGSSTWRIEDITADRVIVTPAPGEPAKMPFWHGDSLGRPVELGQAFGAFLHAMVTLSPQEARTRLERAGLSDQAIETLKNYLQEQMTATNHMADEHTLVVERFKDELGDWRVCIHSPFGNRVHVPWALAISARVRERLGLEIQTMPSDDGIVLRMPESDTALPSDSILFDPDEIETLVTAVVGSSPLFASRFRECAARALLLPRRRPGKRTPLWQQRQKSANLLQVAAGYGSFPIVLETMRECLQDVFDLRALRQLMADLAARRIRLVQVDTDRASPFASALLFGYLGTFIYEGDAPLAERRAAALSLDTVLLSELLGQAELRELLDGDELARLELELARRTAERRLRDVDDAHDAVRVLGDLSHEELLERGAEPAWIQVLLQSHRLLLVILQGQERYIAVEDASRYRDALGTKLPKDVPAAFLAPVRDPVADLVSRYARTHGPFHTDAVPYLEPAAVLKALTALERAGRVVQGEFRPGGHGLEWCDAEVLRTLRRRSLARLRKSVEAVPAETLSRFLPAWHNIGSARSVGADALLRAIEQLQGVPLPASALEKLILPARVSDYGPAQLDQLCAAGEVVWVGQGSLGTQDGYVALYLAADAPSLLARPAALDRSELHEAILGALSHGGALFFRQLQEVVGSPSDKALLTAMWDLVWSGWLTNDTLAPVRAVLQGATASLATIRRSLARRPGVPSRLGPPAGAGRWVRVPLGAEGTRKQAALAEQLLDRHGILSRDAVTAEGVEGGFAGIYPVLKAFEEAGRCRRGYFVEGLGAAQFAMPGAVDRLRQGPGRDRQVLVLASTDPANAWGAALPWPKLDDARPARKAGSLVVLVDGRLVLYLEKGGRSLLAYDDDVSEALAALRRLVRDGRLARLVVERVNGISVFDSPYLAGLDAGGFRETPRGLMLRA